MTLIIRAVAVTAQNHRVKSKASGPWRYRCAVVALLVATSSFAEAETSSPSQTDRARIPAAGWDGPLLRLDVSVSSDANVRADRMPAVAHYAIGVIAMPMVVLEPAAALGWPFYMLLGAPWQAAFNTKVEILDQALTAEPLPAGVVSAVREQWSPPAAKTPEHLSVRIASYGLATRSGRKLEAFEPREDLCLVADVELELAHGDAPARLVALPLGIDGRAAGAPPAICFGLTQWSRNDGKLLRQSLAELADVIAALALGRLGSQE